MDLGGNSKIKNERNYYRVPIPPAYEVCFTVGTRHYKYRVLDISEGGLRFLSPRKIYPGAVYVVKLHFPSLEEPFNLNLRIVKCVQLSEREINSESLSIGEKWEAIARFAAMSIGFSDRLCRQIRKLERKQITPAAR